MPDGDRLATKCPHRWRPADLFPPRPGTLAGVPVHLPRDVPVVLRNEYGDLARIAGEIPVLQAIRSLAGQPLPATPPTAGRGIVTTASDRYVPFLRRLLASRRDTGCRLPVEVWSRPGEINPSAVTELADGDVTFPVFPPGHEPLDGFACKPAAMAASRFAEVLFLDADNTLLADPTSLFDHPAYAAAGAVLWQDQVYPPRREAELRRMLDLPPRFTPMESGQVLLDRRLHARGLRAVDALNRHHAVTYRFTHGNKDTFAMGFELAGEPYHVVPVRPARGPDGSLRHVGLDGRPLFHHTSAGDRKFL